MIVQNRANLNQSQACCLNFFHGTSLFFLQATPSQCVGQWSVFISLQNWNTICLLQVKDPLPLKNININLMLVNHKVIPLRFSLELDSMFWHPDANNIGNDKVEKFLLMSCNHYKKLWCHRLPNDGALACMPQNQIPLNMEKL